MANWLIIGGSIRPEGKSAHLAHALAHRVQRDFPDDAVELVRLSDDIDIEGCLACDYCQLGEGCIIEDAMQEVYGLLDQADHLLVVSPVYFAGPPAQFKALLDRLQRYYWQYDPAAPKRPAQLFAIGDGGDPHGFAPLEGIVRSALAVAGFSLGAVHDCVGQDLAALDALAGEVELHG